MNSVVASTQPPDPMVPLRRRALWGAGLALIATGLVGQAVVGPGGWVDVTAQTGALLAALGLVWELLDRTPTEVAYRNGVAVGLGTTVMLTVVNGAVGIAGAETNDVNQLYLVVVVVAVVASLVGRFRARAMALGMSVCASMILIAGSYAFMEGATGLVEALTIHIAFAALFSAASTLLRRAERAQRPEAIA